MAEDKGLVCVTGGTGFIASWLIMKLLQQGYTVRTTIRSHRDNLGFLTSLEGAKERLHFFHADLNEPDSFRAAIEGCRGVFHVAHPVGNTNEKPEEELTKMTVGGTLGILKLCVDSKTVKRVVYTSSAATVVYKGDGRQVVDENTWSDIDLFRSMKTGAEAYMASKTKTEKAALEFAQKNGLDLFTVIPTLVVGPFLCPNLPVSVRMALAMVLGSENHYRYLQGTSIVHVDDVASAHIFLFENPNAKAGRYICSYQELPLSELSAFLSSNYPDIKVPTADSLKDIKGFNKSTCSSKKLLDSGFKFKYGLESMFDGAIQSCKEKGHIPS
ncbi:vestitone reductase [Ziziphus jujuba]|uniref:Vestitone reductase n=1 Tax=Ziziphus jujuba TaxID=326968 RepID=A0ABM3IS86_ZIZJJ|nr:vestitone reductase [Ziziphus jujuba]